VTAWTSFLLDIHASHFQPPESASAPKTQDTSGHLSQTEFGFCDQVSVSLKMSKDTSPLDSEKSLESWNQSVTRRRGEYSARLKSARLTSASASSSWPTISVNESKNSVGKSQEPRNSIPLGTMAAMQDAANWATPAARDTQGQRGAAANARKGNPLDTLPNQMAVYGQANWPTPMQMDHWMSNNPRTDGRQEQLPNAVAKYGHPAPANPSTDGSRQGSLDQSRAVKQWATPNTMDCLPSRSYEAMKRQATNGQRKNRTKPGNLREQIDPLMCQAYKDAQAQANQWGTPTARDHKSGRGNEEREYKELTPMVERTQTGKLNPRWVETLMGLPVGWVMPSCASPVTIALTNYDSSATESCLQQPSELFAF
jgi:hypothetical protein